MAGFEVIIYGRFWVTTEGPDSHWLRRDAVQDERSSVKRWST